VFRVSIIDMEQKHQATHRKLIQYVSSIPTETLNKLLADDSDWYLSDFYLLKISDIISLENNNKFDFATEILGNGFTTYRDLAKYYFLMGNRQQRVNRILEDCGSVIDKN
jgi:hypothetical protein